MVPRKYIDEFTKAINDLSADERKRLGDALEKVDLTDVAIARDAITNIMETFCGAYTDMAAVLGAEFYDGVRELELGEKIGAVAESGRKSEATAGAVRALIQDIVDGKPREVFIGKLLDRADKEIRRASNVCIARNAKLDNKKVKYARVPSGSETCRFCIMLASRGAVYNNEKAASHSHAKCDCRAVPDFGKGIEGYDKEYYKDVYANPENHPEVNEAINARRRELYAENKSSSTNRYARISSRALFTESDPSLDYFGRAIDSHPDMLEDIIEELKSEGVEIFFRDKEVSAYGPSPISGKPGSLSIWNGASITAWMHERDHFYFDRELGFPGSSKIFCDKNLMVEFESRGYNVEIDFANKNGYYELADRLTKIKDEVVNEIIRDEGLFYG